MKTIFKFIIVIPIVCTFLISITFIGIGIYETFHAIYGIIDGQLDREAKPVIRLFQSLDMFLSAFLFLIFSIGFAQLFIPKPSKIMNIIDVITPTWLRVENFKQLKLILWNTFLMTLVALAVGDLFSANGEYDWELALVPVTVLLLALSEYLITRGK